MSRRGTRRRPVRALVAAIVVMTGVIGTACDDAAAPADGEEEGPVMLLTHRGFAVPDEALSALEDSVGEDVVVVVEDDQASMLDLLTASSAGAGIDVVLGLDSLGAGPFLEGGLTARYSPADAEFLPAALRLGGDPLVPVSYTDVCFNYDTEWFDPPPPPQTGEDGDGEDDEVLDAADIINDPTTTTTEVDDTAPPSTLADEEQSELRPGPPGGLGALGREEYAGLAVVADPAHDPFTLALIAGLATRSGGPPDTDPTGSDTDDDPGTTPSPDTVPTDPELVERLRLLRINDLLVADDFQSAYFGAFTAGAADGDRPVVLASALMPAVTVRFTEPLPATVPTAVVGDGCTRLVDYAGVLADGSRPELARRTLDAVLEPEFQFALSDDRGSRPARTDMVRRPEVAAFDPEVEPVLLDPVSTAASVPSLLAAWNQAGALAANDG